MRDVLAEVLGFAAAVALFSVVAWVPRLLKKGKPGHPEDDVPGFLAFRGGPAEEGATGG